MRTLATALVLLAALAPLPIPTTAAQPSQGFEKCGEDIVLVFKNPDLQPREDGKVHASGWFFIQFQAIGERALEIEKFTFSFGKPVEPALRTCDAPEWITGAYLKNYRVDNDPRDGFFVPINTTLVPDGEYGAAVHAYDASNKELVRYYISAMVDNGNRQSTRDPPQKDFTAPWPIVLPGDGEQTNTDVNGLTIEFAEPVLLVEARLNGALLPLEEWTPPARDDDAVPDNPVNPSLVNPRVWGPGFKWNGPVLTDDVLHVRAIDPWGNEANKILHIGDPTIGGRIDLGFPKLEYVVDAAERTANERGQATYNFTITNIGNGSAHGNIVLERTEGLRGKFSKDHVTIRPGENLTTTLTVTAEAGTQPGSYEQKGYFEYKHGEVEERVPFSVRFALAAAQTEAVPDAVVNGTERPPGSIEEPTDTGPATTSGEEKGTPGPGLILVAAAAVAAAGIARRLRR